MNARQHRALRGAAAAAVAVTLAAVSHTVAGGSAPGPLLVLGVIVLVWPVTTILVGRRMRPVALAAAVIVAQLMLHGVFWATAGMTHAAGSVAHVHGGALLPAVGETVMPAASGDPLMLIAHALAAVATFALLLRGELRLGAVAGWFGRLLVRANEAVPELHPLPRAYSGVTAPIPRHPHLTRVSRRGPPALSGDARVA